MRFEYEDYIRLQRGAFVFVCFCGFPALELNGFGVGVPITVPIAIASVVIGGAAGGALICPRPVSAGLIGGLIAGLSGFLAVYYDVKFRQNFLVLELTLVQAIASTPGWLIGYLLKKSLSTTSSISSGETKLIEWD